MQSLLTGKLPMASDMPLKGSEMIDAATNENQGGWDSAVLTEFASLAEQCLSPKSTRDERPALDKVLHALMDLEEKSRA